MKRNEISRAFDEVAPNAATKQHMLEQVMLARKETHMKKHMRILAPVAACLVLVLVAALAVPQLITPQQPTTYHAPVSPPAPSDLREVQVYLPTMLAGQTVTWRDAGNVAENMFNAMVVRLNWAVAYYPDALEQMVGNMRMHGLLEDGRMITLGLNRAWQGELDELEQAFVRLEALPIQVLEVGATVTTVFVQCEQSNTAAIFRGYVSSISEAREQRVLAGDDITR